MKNNLLIFGYGDTAQYLAKIMDKDYWHICGTSRTKTADNYCQIIKFNKHEISKILLATTHILISVPPDNDGDVIINEFRELLDQSNQLKWIGYLSSTGVYGNHYGAWVDENSKTIPTGQLGINRLRAEDQWTKLAYKKNICINIFRLAGIYGKHRNALENVRNGNARSIYKANHVFSRIHIFDIAQTIKKAIYTSYPYEIYNVADNYPCSTIEVNNYAANLLNLPKPRIINYSDIKQTNKFTENFYKDNKRVSNEKIKTKLGINLTFPTYKEGLEYIFKTL